MISAFVAVCLWGSGAAMAGEADLASADSEPTVVPDSVLPRPVSVGTSERYAAWAAARGRTGARTRLACGPWLERLELCFTYEAAGVRRWVTEADLEAWNADRAAVEAQARSHVETGWTEERPAFVEVEGGGGSYLLSAQGDELDMAGVFLPDRLSARLGTAHPAVGMPARGVFIAFSLEDDDLAHIVTVGIRRAWDSMDEPLSPLAYRWNGSAWETWGEAKPAGSASSGEAGGSEPDPLR